MDKNELRRQVRERVASIPFQEKQQKSTMLALALLVHPLLREAQVVALFSPLPDEPQIGELIELLAKERCVALPRVEGDTMQFYPFSAGNLAKGAYGIMEPVGDSPLPPEEIDVMVLPGVAFTADGLRMGRGKGYYDKYMSQSQFRAHKIAVCYSEQLLPSLPCEPHDIPVDEVVSR